MNNSTTLIKVFVSSLLLHAASIIPANLAKLRLKRAPLLYSINTNSLHHTTHANMASLPSVPAELLFLVYSLLPSRHDLLSLSLVCHKIRPSAQTELHTAINLNQPKWDCHSEYPTISTIGLLLRTLINRPDLAKDVRRLNMVVVKQYLVHYGHEITAPSNIPPEAFSKLNPLVQLPSSIWNLGLVLLKQHEYYNEAWMNCMEAGYEPAFAGLVLALIPSLECLSMRIYTYDVYKSSIGTIKGFKNINHFSTRANHFSTRSFFGVQTKDFQIGLIAGLANLKSIHFHGELPGQILKADSLRTAEFRMQRIPRCILQTVAQTCSSSRITTLIIHLDVAILEDQFDLVETKYQFLLRFIVGLKYLTYLNFQLFMPPWSNNTRISPCGGYDKILALIPNPNLKTLVIDEANIDWSRRRWSSGHPAISHHDIPCATELLGLPSLQRIVAPQAFFFNAWWENPAILLKRCAIPVSITNLEIIDPTHVADTFAKEVMGLRHTYENVRQILLWYDRQKVHVVADEGLEKVVQKTLGLSLGDAEAIHIAIQEGSVWGQLKHAGVEILEDWGMEKGWRLIRN